MKTIAGALPLFVLGETNTRLKEEASWRAQLGLGGVVPRWTWDSYRNTFNGTNAFSALFICSFTRFFHTVDVNVDGVLVLEKPSGEAPKFWISDHFALYCRASKN